MASLSSAFVTVSKDHNGYKVHYATERGLGNIHQQEGQAFVDTVSRYIFENNPKIKVVNFQEEPGVPSLPIREVCAPHA